MLKKIYYFMLMMAVAIIIAVGGYKIVDMLNHEDWVTMIIYITEEAFMMFGFYQTTNTFLSLFNKEK